MMVRKRRLKGHEVLDSAIKSITDSLVWYEEMLIATMKGLVTVRRKANYSDFSVRHAKNRPDSLTDELQSEAVKYITDKICFYNGLLNAVKSGELTARINAKGKVILVPMGYDVK